MHTVYLHTDPSKPISCSAAGAAGRYTIGIAIAGVEVVVLPEDRESMRHACLQFRRATDGWLAADAELTRAEGEVQCLDPA